MVTEGAAVNFLAARPQPKGTATMTQTPRGFDSQDSQDPYDVPSAPPVTQVAPGGSPGQVDAADRAAVGTDPAVGAPADPLAADPLAVDRRPSPDTSTPGNGTGRPEPHRVTRAGMVWTAVAAALVVLVLLIVFILQNQAYVQVRFFGLEGSVPLGVALFIAAVGGGILVAIAGAARIIQLRVATHRQRKRLAGQSSGR